MRSVLVVSVKPIRSLEPIQETFYSFYKLQGWWTILFPCVNVILYRIFLKISKILSLGPIYTNFRSNWKNKEWVPEKSLLIYVKYLLDNILRNIVCVYCIAFGAFGLESCCLTIEMHEFGRFPNHLPLGLKFLIYEKK